MRPALSMVRIMSVIMVSFISPVAFSVVLIVWVSVVDRDVSACEGR